MTNSILDQGHLSFRVESRILRELGERLDKRPEVAIVELIKNAYDADATECKLIHDSSSISVLDDGRGMNLQEFTNGWMRIGTSSKEISEISEKFSRRITGAKGIGRFAVRFLGRKLHLESVAHAPRINHRTRITANFDWRKFDENEDLGEVQVPYLLERSDRSIPTGIKLKVSNLRINLESFDLNKVRTSSIGVISPLSSLLIQMGERIDKYQQDPGFKLKIQRGEGATDSDVASLILDKFTHRAKLKLNCERFDLRVFKHGDEKPYFRIFDTYPNHLKELDADIRFFPRRKGAFAKLPVDGRRAYSWIAKNSGVAVFDRNFRISPYGMDSNDWLLTDADAARNRRNPRSFIAEKHFPMSVGERGSTSENWMLRLPLSAQLIGLVSVKGQRVKDAEQENVEGLIASADREGFVENEAFNNLFDLIRSAVEAIAYVDRRIQLEQDKKRRERLVESIKEEAKFAIAQVQNNPDISNSEKNRIIRAISQTLSYAVEHEEATKEQQRQLEVMSLLGVVAGFMTHEFGIALQELETTHTEIVELGKYNTKFEERALKFAVQIDKLKNFVTYSSAYIRGSKMLPDKKYPAKPRIQQVVRIFG